MKLLIKALLCVSMLVICIRVFSQKDDDGLPPKDSGTATANWDKNGK